mgnify:CR=1 FL=1
MFDPFVGTAGLLIPPASNGATVFGCDLDMRVLNGYSVGRIKDQTIILLISSFKHTHQKFILISNNMTYQDPILLEWIAQNAHLHHILNLMQLLLILHMVFEL